MVEVGDLLAENPALNALDTRIRRDSFVAMAEDNLEHREQTEQGIEGVLGLYRRPKAFADAFRSRRAQAYPAARSPIREACCLTLAAELSRLAPGVAARWLQTQMNARLGWLGLDDHYPGRSQQGCQVSIKRPQPQIQVWVGKAWCQQIPPADYRGPPNLLGAQCPEQ